MAFKRMSRTPASFYGGHDVWLVVYATIKLLYYELLKIYANNQ